MTHSFTAIIPARESSSRLPGKMLADIHGTPLLIRTAHQALRSKAEKVIIACDSEAIFQVANTHHIAALLTKPEHPSGTDRLAEAVRLLELNDDHIIVNVQGDEPLIDPLLIDTVAIALATHPEAEIATCAYPITEASTLFNPNVVKVVCDTRQRALYFSRAPIPWARDAFLNNQTTLPQPYPALHHIGLYAYRVRFLKQYPLLSMGIHERLESLEQLRALEHGFEIHVVKTNSAPLAGVDTAEDLERVRNYLA